MNYVRRFVFVHYEDLLEVRFRKLEQVTDKLFVFVPESTANVPLWLVRQMQNMGSDIDWIELGDVSREEAATILSFQVGTLHEKIDLGVEFAILSDDTALDALVEHVYNAGRTCIRVRHSRPDAQEEDQGGNELKGSAIDSLMRDRSVPNGKGAQEDSDDELELIDLDLHDDRPELERLPEGFKDYQAFVSAGRDSARTETESRDGGAVKTKGSKNRREASSRRKDSSSRQTISQRVESDANDVVRRLIRTGNRPADLPMLRSYISLHVESAESPRLVEKIIEQMSTTGELSLSDGKVEYKF